MDDKFAKPLVQFLHEEDLHAFILIRVYDAGQDARRKRRKTEKGEIHYLSMEILLPVTLYFAEDGACLGSHSDSFFFYTNSVVALHLIYPFPSLVHTPFFLFICLFVLIALVNCRKTCIT